MTDPAPSVFTKIISGEFPGRFVWRDDDVVAFLTIAPIRPGHVLVVPVEQVDKWTDVDAETWAQMCSVSRSISKVVEKVFECDRVGIILAGLEVPHAHIHLIPIRNEGDLSFANADPNPDPAEMDEHAERIRTALQAVGHAEATNAEPT